MLCMLQYFSQLQFLMKEKILDEYLQRIIKQKLQMKNIFTYQSFDKIKRTVGML